MLRRLLPCIILVIASSGFGQDLKISTFYGRVGFGVSQFWYQQEFQETHTGDSVLYFYNNGEKKQTHAGMSLHAEGGYCFVRSFRVGTHVRARVYLENSTQLPGIYTWIAFGPTAEYYFNERIALFGRAQFIFDTQFRDADNRFSWGAGLGLRYLPPEIEHFSISFAAEYNETKGDFMRYTQSAESTVPIRIDQVIHNRGLLLELGINVEF